MIHWLTPAALGGLALFALPILIHLLRTREAQRIRFPTLRFVAAARTAAVRLRLPADWLLLCIRLAIVAASVAAVAGPVIVTASRIRDWNGRVVRAVVVDTGPAMSVPDASGRIALESAREAAAAEVRGAMTAALMEDASVRDGLVRAAAWLTATPPARREIVVLSRFAEGAVRARDVESVPAGVGLRLIRVGDQGGTRRLAPLPLFGLPGASARTIDAELNEQATHVRVVENAASASGLTIQGPDPQSREVQRLFRSVAAAGAPAPSSEAHLVCVFGEADRDPSATRLGPGTPRWMVRTLTRLLADRELRRVGRFATGSTLKPSDVWTAVAVDRSGLPMVQAATQGGALVMRIGAAPESFVAAAAVRALLAARAGATSRPDQEVLRTPAETLSAWSRPAAGVDSDAWRRVESSDSRWFWLLAVLLLLLEGRIRRAKASLSAEVRDAA